MARRPTIEDVAAAAGVSSATVDRVLNGRQKVREETARKVYEAARHIGYHGAPLIAQRMQADLPLVRFGFVLSKEKQNFYQSMRAELEAAAAAMTTVRAEMQIRFCPSQSPSDFAAEMEAVAEHADVIAAAAVAQHETTAAVERLQDRGIPCFALLNDFAQGVRRGYLGMNNLKVGRIAASMISLAVRDPGKVALFVGGHRWHGHQLRETGFRSYFREYAPQFQVMETLVNLETRQLTYEATLDLLHRHPDLRGIYCAGGGMEGAIAALRESRAPGEVALVVNELTTDSRAALADRYLALVIGTPLPKLCRDALGSMLSGLSADGPHAPSQQFLSPDLFLPECV